MSEENKGLWQKTKDWAGRHPVAAGVAGGFAAGSVIPGIGNVAGAIVGGIVGSTYTPKTDDAEKSK